MSNVIPIRTCAACGKLAEGHYSIHRDGFGIGPEVDLCNACGSEAEPSCEFIWAEIAERRKKVAK